MKHTILVILLALILPSISVAQTKPKQSKATAVVTPAPKHKFVYTGHPLPDGVVYPKNLYAELGATTTVDPHEYCRMMNNGFRHPILYVEYSCAREIGEVADAIGVSTKSADTQRIVVVYRDKATNQIQSPVKELYWPSLNLAAEGNTALSNDVAAVPIGKWTFFYDMFGSPKWADVEYDAVPALSIKSFRQYKPDGVTVINSQ